MPWKSASSDGPQVPLPIRTCGPSELSDFHGTRGCSAAGTELPHCAEVLGRTVAQGHHLSRIVLPPRERNYSVPVIPSQEYLHGQDGTRSHPAASGVRPGAGGREGARLPPRACSVPGPRGVHGGGKGKGSGANRFWPLLINRHGPRPPFTPGLRFTHNYRRERDRNYQRVRRTIPYHTIPYHTWARRGPSKECTNIRRNC